MNIYGLKKKLKQAKQDLKFLETHEFPVNVWEEKRRLKKKIEGLRFKIREKRKEKIKKK